MARMPGALKNLRRILGNTFRFRSIQFIITASFTLTTIFAILFVGITFYSRFTRAAELNASISTRQTIEQVSLNLEHYLKSMLDISNRTNFMIYIDSNIPNKKFSEQVDAILKIREDIVSLAVFSDKGELITGVPYTSLKEGVDVTSRNWFMLAMEKYDTLFYSSPHVQDLFKGENKRVVSLSRNITFYSMDRGAHGVLLVDMNFKEIDDLCKRVSLGKKGYIYIVDPYGGIIYHPRQDLIDKHLINENTYAVVRHADGSYLDNNSVEKKLITLKTVSYTGWRIVGVSYMDEIVTTRKDIGDFAVIILVFGVLFALLASAFISSKISQPIKKLEKYMKMVERGNFDVNVEVKGEDEVVQLSKTFNIMVSRIRHLMDQILLEQEAKRKSELDALQAQINPHFLYNTLDSVIWMADSGKTGEVKTMVAALARLFRISISKGKNVISVSEELEHARNYMIIQSMRFKNKFSFSIEAQEEALRCKTLKLILQPIIENSIYHGIEHMTEGGTIRVSVSVISDRLLFQVDDNGQGIAPEVLEKLLTNGSETYTGSVSGIGVKNVHERIQLYYGRKFGLQIESELDMGTRVKIWQPAIYAESRIDTSA